MTNRIIKIAAICLVVIVAFYLALLAFFMLPDYLDYRKNKGVVKDYMEQNYAGVNYSLEKIDTGDSKFPADGRYSDEFLYYDRDNDFYFWVECSEGKIFSDGYDKSFDGKQILSETKKECDIDDDKALMHAYAQNLSDDTYSYVNCQVVVFSKDDAADFKTAFEMYHYMNERCVGGVRYILSFANDSERKGYEKWFKYKSDDDFVDLPHIAYCTIESDNKITDLQEFITFVKKYHEEWKLNTYCG